MAWGSSEGAIALYDGDRGFVGFSKTTSTTTLYIAGDQPQVPGSAGRLRMWSITGQTLKASYEHFDIDGVNFLQLRPSTPDPDYEGTTLSWQCYIDSDADYEFRVDTVDASDFIIKQTSIPAERKPSVMVFDRITSYAGGRIYQRSEERRKFRVFYKDPCVVVVPASLGGGYLMLLARYRVDADADQQSAGPGTSIADIVCFWAADPSFTGVHGTTLKGPFLLVHSADALNDPYRYDEGLPAAPNFEVLAKGSPYLDEPEGARDGAKVFNNEAGFRQACVVRLVRGESYRRAIRWGFGDIDEENWTVASAIPGELGVPIRAWLAVAGQRYRVKSFTEEVVEAAKRAGSIAPPKSAGTARPFESPGWRIRCHSCVETISGSS